GVNRIGFDNMNLEYNGHSQMIDFFGNFVLEPQETEGVFITELHKEKLDKTRKKFNFLNDRDSFELKP
ncbi:MAG: nitrilase family protein, partial [Flavobacterium sp.]|nr:nitrilase family protein [Flavobacterium sp.]